MQSTFQSDVEDAKRKLRFHEGLGVLLQLVTLGVVANRKNIGRCRKQYEASLSDLKKYEDLRMRAYQLDEELETIEIQGVRIGKHTFSDLSVMGVKDYGINWEVLRQTVLDRDSYQCQEGDGYCGGPLQIHHRVPISRGGSNSLDNLITLCYYHHSRKHKHMRNQYHGNIRC